MLTFGEFASFLDAAAARAHPAMALETHHLMAEVEAHAKDLIGRENPEWPPLAESTIAEKTQLGYTGQVSATDPLLRTGDLRASISSSAEMTGIGAEGVVGSDSEIAKFQEIGTSRIPPRPFLGLAMMKAEPHAVEEFGHLAVELLTPGVR